MNGDRPQGRSPRLTANTVFGPTPDINRHSPPRQVGVDNGKTVRLWQSSFQALATFPAKPGGAVDLRTWPVGLSPRVSTGTASVQLPD